MTPPVSGLIRSADLAGDDETDTALLRTMAADAERYLASFRWCTSIEESFFGVGVGGIVAVFLVRIVPALGADDWLWVVTGDLPSLYLSGYDFERAEDALAAYVRERWAWVSAVEAGIEPDATIAPAGVPPSIEWAADLKRRLVFIEKNIL